MAEVVVIPVMSLYEGSKTIIKIYSDWSEGLGVGTSQICIIAFSFYGC